MPGAFGSLTVNIRANIRGFQKGMAVASASMGKFASSASSSAATAESRFAASSKRIGGSMMSIGLGMMSVGGTMTKFVSLPLASAGIAAVKFAADYEQALTNAVSVTGLTGKAADRAQSSMDGLAKKMGRETAFSAQDAAGAMYDLASSGWKASDMGKGLRGIMDLASATQSDLSQTTSTVTATLGQFGMKAGDSGKVADIFTKAIGSSKANMDRLSSSMKTVGPVAHALGMPLTDTTAILSKLYDAGFEGEAAGTALRGSLSALMNPVGQTKEGLKSLGLTVEDVNPKTHKFTDILRTLASHGMDAKTAVQLFGREGAPAMLAVAKQSGGIDKLSNSLKNAGGSAKQVAEQQLNTFGGQMTILKGSLQTAAIVAGQKFTPALKGIAEKLIPLVNGFASLPAPMMATVLGIAAVAAAAGPLLFIIGGMATGLGALITIAPAVGAAITVMTGPIGLAVIGIAALAAGAYLVYKNWGSIAPWLGKQWHAITSGVIGLKNTVIGGFRSIGGRVIEVVSGIPSAVGGALSSLPAKVGPALGSFAGTVAGYIVLGARAAGKGAAQLVGNVVGWIKKLPARTAEGFSSFSSSAGSAIGMAATQGTASAGRLVSGVVGWVRKLPARTRDGLSGFASAVGSTISRAAREAPATAGRMVSGVVGWVKSLPGKVGKALSGFIGSITRPFQRAYDRVVGHSIVPDMVRGVVGWVSRLPGMLVKALANMPGVIGRQFVNMKDRALAGLGGLRKGAAHLTAQAGKAITEGLSSAAHKGVASLGWLRDKGTGALSGLAKRGGNAAGQLKNTAVGQFEKLRSGGYGKIGKLAADGVAKFWEMEKKGIRSIGSFVDGGVSRYEKMRKGGASRFSALSGSIRDSLAYAKDKGSARIQELGSNLYRSFKNQAGEASKRYTNIRENISTKLKQGKEWGSQRIHELGSNLFESFRNQANDADKRFTGIRSSISTKTKQARDWGSDRMRELGKTMGSVWDSANKAAGNFGNKLHATIKDKFGWVVNTARYWMGGLMVAVGRVLSAIGAGDLGKTAESYGGKLKSPLKFAEGGKRAPSKGYVDQASYIAGEDLAPGQREYIITESKKGSRPQRNEKLWKEVGSRQGWLKPFGEKRGTYVTEPGTPAFAKGGVRDQAARDVWDYARKANGSPYTWGGGSFGATDCSGWVDLLIQKLGGVASPSGRTPLASTASMPGSGAPGWGTLTYGFVNGGAGGGHTSATIVGDGWSANTETGGAHGNTWTNDMNNSGPAAGAQNPYFGGNNRVYHFGVDTAAAAGGGGGSGGSGGGGSVFDWLGAITSGLSKVAAFPQMGGDLGKGVMSLGPTLLGKAKDWLMSKGKSLFGSVKGAIGGVIDKLTGGGQENTAKWMAKAARSRSMPGELPVMTSLVESGLQNLNYGDGSSTGLFQQTDNGAWGSAADRVNPEKSLGMFLSAASAYRGQYSYSAGGLGNWAQAVQRSAYPDRYAAQFGNAQQLIGKDLQGYGLGGVIPGPKGKSAMIQAHAGERILPAALADPVYRLAKSAELWSSRSNGPTLASRAGDLQNGNVDALAKRLEAKLDERMKQAERHTAEQVKSTVSAVYAAQMSDLGTEILDRVLSAGLSAHDDFVAGSG